MPMPDVYAFDARCVNVYCHCLAMALALASIDEKTVSYFLHGSVLWCLEAFHLMSNARMTMTRVYVVK